MPVPVPVLEVTAEPVIVPKPERVSPPPKQDPIAPSVPKPVVTSPPQPQTLQTNGKYPFVIRLFLVLVVAAGGLLYFKGSDNNDKASACQQLLSDATQNLSEGNFEVAQSKARMAVVSCSKEQLDKANALQRNIEKESISCSRNISAIQNILLSKQQSRALQKVGELSNVCAKSQNGRDIVLTVKNSQPVPIAAPNFATAPLVATPVQVPKLVETLETIAPVAAQPKSSPVITPVPAPTTPPPVQPQGTSQIEQNILSKATADLQGARLDSALARVNTVLEMNQANADAKRMRAEIKRLQDKAIREIKIE